MTEQRQPSPISFISSLAASSRPKGPSVQGMDSHHSNDQTFHRELERASQGTDVKRRYDDQTRSNHLQSTSRAGRQQAADAGNQASRSSHESSRRKPDATSDSQRQKVSDQSAGQSARLKKENVSEGKALADSEPHQEAGGVSSEQSLVNKPDNASQLDGPAALSDATTVDELLSAGASAAEASAENDVNGKTAVNAKTAEGLVGGDDASMVKADQVEEIEVKAAAADRPSVTDKTLALGTKADSSIEGRHVSAVELAGRQAMHKNTAESIEKRTSGSSLAAVRSTAAGVVNETGLSGSSQSAISLAQRTMVQADAESGVPAGSEIKSQAAIHGATAKGTIQRLQVGTNQTSNESLQSEQLLTSSDSGIHGKRLLTANDQKPLDANGSLQHIDLRLAADNGARELAQQKEILLKNAEQVQVQQIALQQRMSTAAASQLALGDLAGSSSQIEENMFLTMPGGIVTAPVPGRADAASMLMTHAPANMHILSQDADKAMVSNIRWMVNEGVKNAVVNVTPSGMGPISVSIGLEKEQMTVSIVALQGSTREALDNMVPRLREQLAAQGHDSVKVDISDGRSDQSARGYGQQFSGENSAYERGTTQNESNPQRVEEKHLAEQTANAARNVLHVNNSVPGKGRYDVYV